MLRAARLTKRHRWVSGKIVFGTMTHCVASVQITEPTVAECDMMPELLRRVVANGGQISEWLGDAGGEPYFDWPERVTGKTRPIIRRLYNKFLADQDDYWRHYHQRSLAETGISMMKTRFGHYLRSRVPHAQYAESCSGASATTSRAS